MTQKNVYINGVTRKCSRISIKGRNATTQQGDAKKRLYKWCRQKMLTNIDKGTKRYDAARWRKKHYLKGFAKKATHIKKGTKRYDAAVRNAACSLVNDVRRYGLATDLSIMFRCVMTCRSCFVVWWRAGITCTCNTCILSHSMHATYKRQSLQPQIHIPVRDTHMCDTHLCVNWWRLLQSIGMLWRDVISSSSQVEFVVVCKSVASAQHIFQHFCNLYVNKFARTN